MTLSVLTASDERKLITLSTVKTRLGITVSTHDTTLTELIEEASSAIEEYVGRDLARQRYTETVAGLDRDRILLSRFPVDPESVTLTIDGTADTTFAVEDAEHGILFYDGGWPSESDQERTIAVTYRAGYVLPGSIGDWTAATAYTAASNTTVASWVRPTALNASPLLFECTTAGTSHASTQPTWPTTAGGTVTDSSVTWTARTAKELPAVLRNCAWLATQYLWATRSRAAGVASMKAEDFEVSYFATQTETLLPTSVIRALGRWRLG